MRALIQRVTEASVTVDGKITGQIGPGLCIFLGVKHDDTSNDAEKLVRKVINLRIFSDADGKMNRSLLDVSGALLIVSQFTLYADLTSGNRPSYSKAANPELARELYDTFTLACKQHIASVATGVFQAHMKVRLLNDGPVTLMCSSGE